MKNNNNNQNVAATVVNILTVNLGKIQVKCINVSVFSYTNVKKYIRKLEKFLTPHVSLQFLSRLFTIEPNYSYTKSSIRFLST